MKRQHGNSGSVPRRGRGRPTGGEDMRAAIVEEARRQFGEHGYRSTTLRSIARSVGVDARLVIHYFGSKRELFMASVRLPVEPERMIAVVFAGGAEDAPARAAEFVIDVIEDPERRDMILALLRGAVSEPEVAEMIRGFLTARLLGPIAAQLGGNQPQVRASMLATTLVGLAVVRYVVRIEPLAAMSREQLVLALTPVFEHYLRGDWVIDD